MGDADGGVGRGERWDGRGTGSKGGGDDIPSSEFGWIKFDLGLTGGEEFLGFVVGNVDCLGDVCFDGLERSVRGVKGGLTGESDFVSLNDGEVGNTTGRTGNSLSGMDKS